VGGIGWGVQVSDLLAGHPASGSRPAQLSFSREALGLGVADPGADFL
jgi:hypothetical protein